MGLTKLDRELLLAVATVCSEGQGVRGRALLKLTQLYANAAEQERKSVSPQGLFELYRDELKKEGVTMDEDWDTLGSPEQAAWTSIAAAIEQRGK